MSSRRSFAIVRKILLATVVGSALAVPAAAHAESISGERALLGRVGALPGAARTESASMDPVRFENSATEGERALLGKSGKIVLPEATAGDKAASRASLDGARALLSENKI